MKIGYLTDGDLNADVIPTESHVLLQLKGFMEIWNFAQGIQERLQKERQRGR